jgi:hypothetical protein
MEELETAQENLANAEGLQKSPADQLNTAQKNLEAAQALDCPKQLETAKDALTAAEKLQRSATVNIENGVASITLKANDISTEITLKVSATTKGLQQAPVAPEKTPIDAANDKEDAIVGVESEGSTESSEKAANS